MLLLCILDTLPVMSDTLGNVLKQQGLRKIDHVVDVSKRDQDRYIRNMHLRNRFQTATASAANTNGIHNNRKPAQTVRNRLREGGLGARRPHLRCVFARRHGINRVNWARTHQRLVRQQWNNVLFSDESRFTIHRGDDRVRVYSRGNERYADFCVLERDRFGGVGSVLVWADIAHSFRTNLAPIEVNLNASCKADTRTTLMQG